MKGKQVKPALRKAIRAYNERVRTLENSLKKQGYNDIKLQRMSLKNLDKYSTSEANKMRSAFNKMNRESILKNEAKKELENLKYENAGRKYKKLTSAGSEEEITVGEYRSTKIKSFDIDKVKKEKLEKFIAGSDKDISFLARQIEKRNGNPEGIRTVKEMIMNALIENEVDNDTIAKIKIKLDQMSNLQFWEMYNNETIMKDIYQSYRTARKITKNGTALKNESSLFLAKNLEQSFAENFVKYYDKIINYYMQ